MKLKFLTMSFLTFFSLPFFQERFLTSHLLSFLVFLILSLLVIAFHRREVFVRTSPSLSVPMILLGLLIASSVYSVHPIESFQWGLVAAGCVALFYFLPPALDLRLVVWIGAIEAVVCLVQASLTSFGTRVSAVSGKMLIAGTLGNPEYVAYFLTTVLMVLLFDRNLFSRWAAYAFGVLLTLGLLLTESRIALASAFVAFTVTTVYRKPRSFARVATLAILLLASAAGVALVPSALQSFQGRFLSAASALQVAHSHWDVGVGLGQLKYYYLSAQTSVLQTIPSLSARAAFTDRAHNEFLDILAETGLVGFFLLTILFWQLLKESLRHLEESKNLFPLIWTIFTFMMSLFSFPFHVLPNLLLIVFLSAFIFDKSGFRRVVIPRQLRTALVLLSVVVGWQALTIGISESQLKLSLDSALAGENEKASRHIVSAFYWAPWKSSVLMQKARLEYSDFHSDKALATLAQISPWPATVDAYKLRGLALQSLGQWDLAQQNYLQLEKAFPTMVTPKFYLGKIALLKQDRATADRYFRSVLSLKAVNEKAVFDQTFARNYLSTLK